MRTLYQQVGLGNQIVMVKYEYFDGERRYHHGTIIWYDKAGNARDHWYIRLCVNLQDQYNGARQSVLTREYFATLADAKRFIDGFGED